jgi:hypothetical protein
MSRITTSSASFSRARAAMRRACSREVRVCRVLGSLFFLQCIPGSRTVKTALLDESRDGGRNQPVERLFRGDTRPGIRRGGRIRLDLEEEDALGPVELLQHCVQLAPREAGPRRDPHARQLEHPVRFAPGEECAELVGSDHEHGIVEALGAEQLDRARVRVEADVVTREGRGREGDSVLGGGVDSSMAWTLVDEDYELLDAEALPYGVGDRDVA